MTFPSRGVLAVLLLLPAASGSAWGGEEKPTPVDAARAADTQAYASAIEDLRREHAGEWALIAQGRVVATSPRIEDVASAAPDALHRFLFVVGEDGDGEFPANFWYGPRFGGVGLARALKMRELGGERTEETPFPRTPVEVTTPAGRAETMDVLVGSVGPPLLLTLDDAERLVLARCEVPGVLTSKWIPFPFRRAVVHASKPGTEGGAWIVAAIPTGSRKALANLSRGRDLGWFQTYGGVWNMDPWAAKKTSLAGQWVLFGVDRPLGVGGTAAQALLAGEGKAPEAYHRFLTRLPREGEDVYDEAAFSSKMKVVFNGESVEVRRDPKRTDDVYLGDDAVAARLRLELTEEARCVIVLRKGIRVPARAGAAWNGKRPAPGETGALAWIVYALPAGEKVSECEPAAPMPSDPKEPESGQ